MNSSRKITIIVSVVLGVIGFSYLFIYLNNTLFPRYDVPTLHEGSVIAENWIRNHSQSFPPYGRDLQLEARKEIERGEYEFAFSFTTEDPEYGTHNNEMEVRTKNLEVVRAVTNGIFDEIKNEYIEVQETVKMYLVSGDDEDRRVEAVERTISASVIEDIERVLIEELLSGPTAQEQERGYSTLIERETRLLSFRVEDGTAYVELSIPLDQQAELGREQIVKTIAQLSGITEVRAPERRQVVTLEIEGITEDFVFERDLQEGSTGTDVKYLQIVLNADPDTIVAQQGPGSPGEEAESFGESTTRAVMVFQRKYSDEVLEPAGLILSTGIVDEYTRDKLNSILEESAW